MKSFMMRLKSSILAAALSACTALIGCRPNTPDVELGLDELVARTTVWNEYFKSREAPPTVKWWYMRCPTRPDDPRTAVVTVEGLCYSGLFWGYNCDVAWRGSFSKSAYAHELMHAWQDTRGIFDPAHKLPEWTEITNINVTLSEMGL